MSQYSVTAPLLASSSSCLRTLLLLNFCYSYLYYFCATILPYTHLELELGAAGERVRRAVPEAARLVQLLHPHLYTQ